MPGCCGIAGFGIGIAGFGIVGVVGMVGVVGIVGMPGCAGSPGCAGIPGWAGCPGWAGTGGGWVGAGCALAVDERAAMKNTTCEVRSSMYRRSSRIGPLSAN